MSNPAVIKQHPWVHPKHKPAHPKPFLASFFSSPVLVLSLSHHLCLTLETSFSFTCFTLNHSFPFILILIIPLHYHFYSLISIFRSHCLLFFPFLILFFPPSLSLSPFLFPATECVPPFLRHINRQCPWGWVGELCLCLCAPLTNSPSAGSQAKPSSARQIAGTIPDSSLVGPLASPPPLNFSFLPGCSSPTEAVVSCPQAASQVP